MDTDQFKVGDRVTKGHEVYTVLTEPTNGVFRAKDSKGQTTTVSVREAMLLEGRP
jgi:hypothetical protein